MERLIRTTLSTLTKVLEPKLSNHTAIKRADIKAKWGYKESFNKRNGARELPKLQPGDWVRAKLDNEKQWTTGAKVVREDQSPRSYIIDTGGRRFRRNRRHLRKVPTPLVMTPQGTTPKFRISTVSLLPTSSRGRIPTFLKTATPVLMPAIRTRFQNREPQVVDLLGNLFVIERTFSTVGFLVNCEL